MTARLFLDATKNGRSAKRKRDRAQHLQIDRPYRRRARTCVGPLLRILLQGMSTSQHEKRPPLSALDFFAGSGLVRLGLEPFFRTVWANDCCEKKAAVYAANFGTAEFHLGDIETVAGPEIPAADLAWASFPCQDLSLAGNLSGIRKGTRSGLFWQWIRILDALESVDKRPPVVCAENVTGFLSAGGGRHFRNAYDALRQRGYKTGAIVVDARLFLPQSRPRAFLIGASSEISLSCLTQPAPSLPFHPPSVIRARKAVADDEWVWWSLPSPPARTQDLASVCDRDAPCNSPAKTSALLALLSSRNRRKLNAAVQSRGFLVGAGYRRTRHEHNNGNTQRLEVRFDGIAGCLRTPEGGSSRQIVLIVEDGSIRSRLITLGECARLMGAGDGFQLPGSYNDGYRALGDAVAAPVTRFLAEHLLAPLAARTGRGGPVTKFLESTCATEIE